MVKSKIILILGSTRNRRHIKGRMSSDSKVHGLRILIDHGPAYSQISSGKLMGDKKTEIKRISSLVESRGYKMGDRGL